MIQRLSKKLFASGLCLLQFKSSSRFTFLKGSMMESRDSLVILEKQNKLELDVFLQEFHEISIYKKKTSSSFYKIGIYKVYRN